MNKENKLKLEYEHYRSFSLGYLMITITFGMVHLQLFKENLPTTIQFSLNLGSILAFFGLIMALYKMKKRFKKLTS